MQGLLKHCESFARRGFQGQTQTIEFIKNFLSILNKTAVQLYC